MWFSPDFHPSGDAVTLIVNRRIGQTLSGAVSELVNEELSDGRTLTSSRSHATCHGKLPGQTVDLRFDASPVVTLSQVYHVAVLDGETYALIYTHAAGKPIPRAVQAMFDSVCPQTS